MSERIVVAQGARLSRSRPAGRCVEPGDRVAVLDRIDWRVRLGNQPWLPGGASAFARCDSQAPTAGSRALQTRKDAARCADAVSQPVYTIER